MDTHHIRDGKKIVMKSVSIKRLPITMLALSLGAAPAWAVTDITFCAGMSDFCPSFISDNTVVDTNKPRPGQGFLDVTLQALVATASITYHL